MRRTGDTALFLKQDTLSSDLCLVLVEPRKIGKSPSMTERLLTVIKASIQTYKNSIVPEPNYSGKKSKYECANKIVPDLLLWEQSDLGLFVWTNGFFS